MKAWWICWLSKCLALPNSRRLHKPALLFAAATLLSACVAGTGSQSALRNAVEVVVPNEQVTDYRLAQCESVWSLVDRDAMNNALYWLRTMDCAGRLTPRQAREEAQRLTGDGWEEAFKQSILLDQVRITPVERRQALDRLSKYQQEFPASLRPLMQNWHNRQTFWLALTEERLRYKRLQESSDKQIEIMHLQQSHLQYQLDVTTRKLENLTDIERQLSSRKQNNGELPDNAVLHDAGEAEHPSARKRHHRRGAAQIQRHLVRS